MSVFVRHHATPMCFDKEAWVILDPIEQSIRAKIEKYGNPLRDWDIAINYGIKTGCNEAFIIDGAKRAELIAADPKSDEIIRPYEIARGGWGKEWETLLVYRFLLVSILVGGITLFACSRLSKKWVVRLSWVLGTFAFLLMISTFVWPHYIAGSARYVSLGVFLLDPFAVMLPPYIVLMSHWLSKDKPNKTWTTIGTAALTLFIVFVAIHAPYMFMVQVYLLLFIIMTFKARKNIQGTFYVGIGILIGVAAIMGLAIWHFPHLQHRIMNLGNYATQMSVHAITNSSLVGSTTESLTVLSRLPDSTTDFAFTSMIAKFGMLMGLLILALYGCIAKGLTDTIRNTKDQFNKMVSIGTLGLFAIYTIMALLVAFGILATAAYWPLVGYGSMMFWTWCILFGFVLALNKPTKGKK